MFRGRLFGGRQYDGRLFGSSLTPTPETPPAAMQGGDDVQVSRRWVDDDAEMFQIALAIVTSGALDQ